MRKGTRAIAACLGLSSLVMGGSSPISEQASKPNILSDLYNLVEESVETQPEMSIEFRVLYQPEEIAPEGIFPGDVLTGRTVEAELPNIGKVVIDNPVLIERMTEDGAKTLLIGVYDGVVVNATGSFTIMYSDGLLRPSQNMHMFPNAILTIESDGFRVENPYLADIDGILVGQATLVDNQSI